MSLITYPDLRPFAGDSKMILLRKIVQTLGGAVSNTDSENILLGKVLTLFGGVNLPPNPTNTLLAEILRQLNSCQPTSYNPEYDSNLLAWWKSDYGIATTGALVDSWVDASGNGNDLASVIKPTLVSDFVNGLPGVKFDSTAQTNMKTAATFALNPPFSFYMLFRKDAPVTGGRIYNGLTDGYTYTVAGFPNQLIMRYGGTAFVTETSLVPGTVQVVKNVWSQSGCKTAVFGDNLEQGGTGTAASSPFGGLRFGALNDAGTLDENFHLVECIIRNSHDSNADAAKVQTYLAKRAGIPVRRLITEGDSLTQGAGLTVSDLWPYKAAVALAPVAWYKENVAVGGSTTIDMMLRPTWNVTPYYDPLIVKNVLTVLIGSNDLVDGTAPSVVYSRIVSYCRARQEEGFEVVILTVPPRDPAVFPTFAAAQTALNTKIRNGYAGFASAIVDIAADANLGTFNLTDYLSPTHFTAAGHTKVAALVAPVVATL